jgi:hypothetical protein
LLLLLLLAASMCQYACCFCCGFCSCCGVALLVVPQAAAQIIKYEHYSCHLLVKHSQHAARCGHALLQVHAEVIQRISAGIEAYGFQCLGVTESPLKGDKSGNTEFLAHFQHDASRGHITVPPDGARDEGGDAGRPDLPDAVAPAQKLS